MPLRALITAVSYFSILPVGRFAAGPAPDADALAYLPFVGALIGALAGCAAYGLSFVAPHAIVVAVAFALLVLLTGAIHLDGFLDSSDALFASVSVERRLEILKDPRHGTFAIANVLVLAALWLAALWSLPTAMLPVDCAFAAASARFGAVLNAYRVPYARAGAVTRVFETTPSRAVVALAIVLCVGLGAIIGWHAPLILLAATLVALLLGERLKRRLGGGLVGDVYGFIIVCCEAGIALALAVW